MNILAINKTNTISNVEEAWTLLKNANHSTHTQSDFHNAMFAIDAWLKYSSKTLVDLHDLMERENMTIRILAVPFDANVYKDYLLSPTHKGQANVQYMYTCSFGPPEVVLAETLYYSKSKEENREKLKLAGKLVPSKINNM
jgi:hypothetical protein